MATELNEKIRRLRLVKLRRTGGSASVTLPEEVRGLVGFFPERGFISVRAVGPVIVLAQVRQATEDGAREETDAAIDAAVRQWLEETDHAKSAIGAEKVGNGASR